MAVTIETANPLVFVELVILYPDLSPEIII